MTAQHVHLEAGVSALLEHRTRGLKLGAVSESDAAGLAKGLSRQSPSGTLEAAWQVSVSPAEGDGWTGRPGMPLRRNGVLHHARWVETERTATADAIEVHAQDAASGLEWQACVLQVAALA